MNRIDIEGFAPDSVLGACETDALAHLARRWSEGKCPAGSLILGEDDTDDDVFFLLEGTARAATFTGSGREIMLSDLFPGECFGLFAALDGKPRSTNIIALTDCRVAKLTARAFHSIIESDAKVMRAVMCYLVDRIRVLSTRMTSVTTQNAEERLIAELLRLAEAAGIEGDRAVIKPLPTQQELATVIFSQRESVARDMSKLKDMGLIDRQGRTLTIPSRRALAARLERD